MNEREILEKLIKDGEGAKVKLKALDEPNLKKGDVFVDSVCIVVIGKLLDGKWIATHKDGSQRIGDKAVIRELIRNMKFVYNLIDDLEAMREPLEKFEVCAIGADRPFTARVGGDSIYITAPRNLMYSIDEAQEIHQQLGRLIYEARKKQ